ncbi:MAG TPA: glycosyltransferase family 39 protein [Terracidiphilus sp.]|nr:glycosyltransferase family 39 protein [Terracidiphilus sp.]
MGTAEEITRSDRKIGSAATNGSLASWIVMTQEKPSQSFWRNTALEPLPILAVALVLTAAILFLALPKLDSMMVPTNQSGAPLYTVGFADGYDLIANNLVQGNGYRFQSNASETMMREPGYPLFLAGAFKIGGYNITTARCANWLLTICIAFLLMRLAEHITGDKTVAVLATLLFLFFPSTLIAEARGGVEILFILVVLIFMLFLHNALAKGEWWRYLIAGLALGVVVQVRSTPLVFPFFLFIFLFFSTRGVTERARAFFHVTVLILGMTVVMVPWLVRNYKLVHHLVPTATVQGVALQEGQYTCENLSFENNFYALQKRAGLIRADIAAQLGLPFDGAYYYQVFFTPKDEWTFNQTLFARGKKEYAQHPALLPTCACKNLFNFWFLGKTWHATWLNMVVQVPLLVLAVTGFFLLWRRGQLRRIGPILAFIVCIEAVDLPIIAHARHSVPLVPFLAIPASLAALSLWSKCQLWARSSAVDDVLKRA